MSINKYDPTTGELVPVAGGSVNAFCPIGTILSFGGATAPKGYLLCNGAQVSKTEYKELYNVIGDAFGTASDNTKFVLPDLREATTKGVGLSGKTSTHYDADGVALGEFIEDRIKSHAHNVYVRDAGHAHGTDSGSSLPSPNNLGITKNAAGVGWGANPVAGTASNTQSVSANIQVSSKINFGEIDNATTGYGYATNEVKAVGVNYIIKAKVVSNEADYQQHDDYSTDEVDTGKVWIDGKKIYRKVLLCTIATPLSASGSWTVVNGWTISDATIEKYISIDCSGIDYGARIDHQMAAGGKALNFYCISSNITIPVGAPLIIEYTKTT